MARMEEIVAGLGLKLEHEGLRKEQAEILQALVNGQHAFGIYPTGYGKSDCFALFPSIMDKLHPGKRHVAVIVSPLRSLMMDQVRRWTKVGITSAAILAHDDMAEETIHGIKNGEFSLVFVSPEAALAPEWFSMFKEQGKNGLICLLAFDEVHCMIRWDFREEYKKVSRLRSPLAVPVLCLTATVTSEMVEEIMHQLHLPRRKVLLSGKVPDRPNVYLDKKHVRTGSCGDHLRWVVDLIENDGINAPRTIIYTRTIDECANVWCYLCSALGEKAFHVEGEEKRAVGNRMVDMYHGKTAPCDQERVLEGFTRNGLLRCVVATSAFGMGVQVDDIRHVIHWGPAMDLLDYWQQVGRAGRDGISSTATMYLYPRSCHKSWIKPDMLRFAACDNVCLRKEVLREFTVTGMAEEKDVPNEHCCCVCVAPVSEVTHL